MPPKSVGVMVLAGRHSIAGSLDHRDSRVLDVLSDRATEFLKLQGVEIFRDLHGEPMAQLTEVTIPKSAIECVMLVADTHEAPQKRRYAFVEKQPHHATVVLPNHEIRGTLMLKGTADPLLVLAAGAATFFPISQAKLSGFGAKTPIACQAVLVNKTKVSLMQIEKR